METVDLICQISGAASDQPADELDMAADEAILECSGGLREAIKALIVLTDHLETELAQVSYGYARGRVSQIRAAG